MEVNLEESIDELYQDILKRPADKLGLEYFASMLKNGKMELKDVKKNLLNSEEGKNIQSFLHYSAEYWNDLEQVQRYKNRLATGNKNKDWIVDILSRFKQFLPFKKVLIVGCGNGWLERKLFDLRIGIHFDAFDISESYLETAKKEKGSRSIDYFVDDINTMKKIKNNYYDAIFNNAVLNHTEKLEFAFSKLAKALKPNGLMFNEEYVGPARNQYTNTHLEIMKKISEKLPEHLRSKYPLRPSLENFRVEPTEAIHSDKIRETFENLFDVVYQRNLNGGIAYQILWNNVKQFKNSSDPDTKNELKKLIDQDETLSKNNKVPILFWYGVGIPKY